MLSFDRRSHGGPLFLKLLLDQVTTTSEANLKQLLLILDTYKIKYCCCSGEDISQVVDEFTSIFENIIALNDGDLPVNSIKKLLIVFQTTSVDNFNALFDNIPKQLTNAEIQNSIDPSFALSLTSAGASALGNNMRSVSFTLSYANTAYCMLTFVKTAIGKKYFRSLQAALLFLSKANLRTSLLILCRMDGDALTAAVRIIFEFSNFLMIVTRLPRIARTIQTDPRDNLIIIIIISVFHISGANLKMENTTSA